MKNAKYDQRGKISFYEQLVATCPEAILKGDTIPYTSVNGHMYSMFTKGEQVAIKLPKDQLTEFLEKYDTKLLEQYGIVQKEYAVVPDSLLVNIEELASYFRKSFEYTSGLKPKPTTKSKKTPK